MPAVCFYFQVHQPRRVKRYRIFDIGRDPLYFNDRSDGKLNNRKIIEKVATKAYLPANRLMLELLKQYPEFKISYSLSGVFMEQLEEYSPETLETFKQLAETGQVEFLSETYYHSLSFLYSKDEFKRQVELHADKLWQLFGAKPKVFRNTELIYNNALAKEVEAMGYRGILAEGADHILGWRSPNFVYTPPGSKIKVLLKNYRLSDDIAFRFSSRDWSEYPLSADKFAQWISAVNGSGEVVNLFMDYETFGEHQWADTGIFEFLKALPGKLYKHPNNSFVTPSGAVSSFRSVGEIDVPHFVSWADVERDLSAWLHNSMQQDAIAKLYGFEGRVLSSGDDTIVEDWRRLQTSDHFYYMCTKWWNDGDVHKYFNPYESPYEAFIAFMNVLHDLEIRLDRVVHA
ncbi:MAG: alpha-amylase [Candidatus Taylorbacteria bacterium RIFCSPHIGHO2_02_FULL_46_13]|uniref:Alpha-amylase n=1 Tax=Candidatus Taylorbacteria bacterium RIFCSPHIGHO2_02_FULL_46_13 TaxID=1802312 RepID=A0A1G2MPS4_9BACT|nr:MAG: alpha-amylase [Candidatus Taylorbacteria bacterium RIFCSPHIGHO2_02_FULL_46_13]